MEFAGPAEQHRPGAAIIRGLVNEPIHVCPAVRRAQQIAAASGPVLIRWAGYGQPKFGMEPIGLCDDPNRGLLVAKPGWIRTPLTLMNERQLEYVVAIVETGSFTAAAERCHTAQSALSHQVASLERHLGTQLFDRSGRSVRLTAAGRSLLPVARQLGGASPPRAGGPTAWSAARCGSGRPRPRCRCWTCCS